MTITRAQLNQVLIPYTPGIQLRPLWSWSDIYQQLTAFLLVVGFLYLPFTTEALASKEDLTVDEFLVISDQPAKVVPIAILSLVDAPEDLLMKTEQSLEIVVGESTSDQVIREQREREEAAARLVLARLNSQRDNGIGFEQALSLTDQYAAQYGIDSNLMSAIIACESGYNQYAKNSKSTASGFGQFLHSTWRSTMRAMGENSNTSPFDGAKNLEATAYLLSVRGASPWYSSAACWAR